MDNNIKDIINSLSDIEISILNVYYDYGFSLNNNSVAKILKIDVCDIDIVIHKLYKKGLLNKG